MYIFDFSPKWRKVSSQFPFVAWNRFYSWIIRFSTKWVRIEKNHGPICDSHWVKNLSDLVSLDITEFTRGCFFSIGSWRRYQPVQIWKNKSLNCRESVDIYLIVHAWKEVNILKTSMTKNMESCFSFQAINLKHIHGNQYELLYHIVGYKKWRTMGIFFRVPLAAWSSISSQNKPRVCRQHVDSILKYQSVKREIWKQNWEVIFSL